MQQTKTSQYKILEVNITKRMKMLKFKNQTKKASSPAQFQSKQGKGLQQYFHHDSSAPRQQQPHQSDILLLSNSSSWNQKDKKEQRIEQISVLDFKSLTTDRKRGNKSESCNIKIKKDPKQEISERLNNIDYALVNLKKDTRQMKITLQEIKHGSIYLQFLNFKTGLTTQLQKMNERIQKCEVTVAKVAQDKKEVNPKSNRRESSLKYIKRKQTNK